ncbi:MAG: hypothetical protein JXR96_28550 [Deltaproteobacteria bacterium]|nr:hypothetical protein [Deltaproteobacteria bacterium]
MIQNRRFSTSLSILLGLLLAAAMGCSGTGSGGDGGLDGQDAGPGVCIRDNSERRPATPAEWQLTVGGEPLSDFICPRNDYDYYWFNLSSSTGTILELELANNVALSPVDYCYAIYFVDAQQQERLVGSLCDHDGTNGVTDLVGRHYINTAGNYFVDVYDEGTDDEDANNGYAISINMTDDPDANEINNSPPTATAISDGQSIRGYISYLGDQDWFRVEAGAGDEILRLDLTSREAGPVDLRYEVFESDGTTLVNTGSQFDGMSAPADMHDVLSLGGQGTYYVLITDIDHDDAELEVGYDLQVRLDQEPDVRDRGGSSNDTWEQATEITSGQLVDDAYLASRADQDWYRIVSPYNTTDADPDLIEVELIVHNDSRVGPAVDLIVADPRYSCTQATDCGLLAWECSGDSECGADCMNAQCPSHECVAHEGHCKGSGACLPRDAGETAFGCGITSLIMQGVEWGEGGNHKHLHTVAPMYGKVYFIKVRDYFGTQLDADHAYSLRVTVHDELDLHEPNGLYLPYVTNQQEEATRSWNHSQARAASCSDNGTAVTCTLDGYLSFRGDQDWFVLDIPHETKSTPPQPQMPACDAENPCQNGTTCTDGHCLCANDDDCSPPHWTCDAGACVEQEVADTAVDWGLTFDYSFSGKASVEVYYEMYLGERRRTGFCATPGSSSHDSACNRNSTSGTVTSSGGECVYMCGEYHSGRPVYLRVMHYDRKEYDYSASGKYALAVTAVRECPQECSYCMPEVVDYACPNPVNPNPGAEEDE